MRFINGNGHDCGVYHLCLQSNRCKICLKEREILLLIALICFGNSSVGHLYQFFN